ncbi:MAG TPA: hypothetical protein VFP19_00655 [Candidatus Limnocylindrales bacterium]|nr:hypothetical protein [Candidatus Limnocylindrales bacterium]
MTVMQQSSASEHADDVATLRVHRAGPLDVRRLCPMLADTTWLGQAVDVEGLPPDTTRYLTDLVLPLPPDGRLLSLHKAAFVDLGPVVMRPDGGCDVELAWRSASLAPLFPVFAGHLSARSSGLTIEGHYAPPGGFLGRTADRMLLHTAARGTARWFLGHLAAALREPTAGA